jgi:acyl carrier protein phosphodiesterase
LNYLAHLFLSGNEEEILIGNFIADFVKGKSKDGFPGKIKNGIELHRAIDDFTDHHEITSEGKKRLYPDQHKYAPVVLDVFYDHFLAKNFHLYSKRSLAVFSADAYEIIDSYREILPDRVKAFFPYMKQHNWLLNYSSFDGIDRSLKGLSSRVAFANNMDKAISCLKSGYSLYEKEFSAFFPELITFVGLFPR